MHLVRDADGRSVIANFIQDYEFVPWTNFSPPHADPDRIPWQISIDHRISAFSFRSDTMNGAGGGG
jgi:hypothetical protein